MEVIYSTLIRTLTLEMKKHGRRSQEGQPMRKERERVGHQLHQILLWEMVVEKQTATFLLSYILLMLSLNERLQL